MTFRDWAAYRLMARKKDGISLLLGRRLTQQAVVDFWASNELSRVKWVENNQVKIRSEYYQSVFLFSFGACAAHAECSLHSLVAYVGLMDALAAANGAVVMGRDVGRIVFPSTQLRLARRVPWSSCIKVPWQLLPSLGLQIISSHSLATQNGPRS